VLLRNDSGTITDLRTAGYLVIDLLQGTPTVWILFVITNGGVV
jgi:hypothetical protein